MPFWNAWMQIYSHLLTLLLVALAISMKLISSCSPNTLFDLTLSSVHSETTTFVVLSSSPTEGESPCAIIMKSFQSSGAWTLNSSMMLSREICWSEQACLDHDKRSVLVRQYCSSLYWLQLMLGIACSLNGEFHLPTEQLCAGAAAPADGAFLSLLSD